MPFLTRESLRIYYEVEGAGPAIVLHTGGGGDLRGWQLGGYAAGLEGFRRILVDHRGHGKSDSPQDPSAHRMEAYRDDVIALLDELGEERVAFLGYSYGALVGCAVAAAYPGRVAGLIALDGLDTDDWSSAPARKALRQDIDQVHQSGLATVIRRWAREEGYSGPEWFLQNLSSTDSRMFELLLEGAMEWNGPASLLPRLRIPLLCLWAEKTWPPDQVERFRTLVPKAQIRLIPGATHLGIFARSELLLPEIRSFLRSVFRE
jgi:pimeloyl-ACP methyl ester carboxylesterase